MKLKTIILLVITEMFFLAQIILSIVAIVLLPIYLYQNGGWDILGLTVLLLAWTLFSIGLIFRR